MRCRMLTIFPAMLLAAFAEVGATSQGRLVCPVNSQRLLTGDTTVLNPSTGISSSSEDNNNPARDFVDPSRSWCSAEDTFDVSGQYVELNFTEPIVATILVSGGKQTYFVMNFTISHTEALESDNFQPYGVLKPVQEFIVQSLTTSDAYLALEIPILAKKMKFIINGGRSDPFDRICWSMRIYGCRASEARMIMEDEEPTTVPLTTSSSTTDDMNPYTTAASIELPSSINCPVQESFAQRDLLLVVIPSAVVLLVVILIAVTSGVIICLCVTKNPHTESPTYESVKVKILNKRTKEIVDNGTTAPGLYDQPRPQFYDVPKASLPSPSPFRSSTSSIGSNMEVRNPVYLEKKNLEEMGMALKQLPPDDGNDYEDVLEAMPPKHRLDRQTQANAGYSSNFYRPPLPPTEVPNNDNVRPPLPDPSMASRTMSLDGSAPKYSRVAKEKRTGGDGGSERGRSASPVIKSHYMSTNAAITEELNRLTTELENSLKGQS